MKQIHQISDKMLLINLYLTQAVSMLLALIILFFQNRSIKELFHVTSWGEVWAWGALFAALVVFLDIAVSHFVPEHMTDDGGINERLFAQRPIWHIFIMSLIIAIAEELLFRGAIQHAFGPYWTSILFTAIHIRYLRHWLMTGMVFTISYGLGWIYLHTGMLSSAIAAHFLIDFILGCLIRMGSITEKR